MNKERYQLYLEGFEKDYWDIRGVTWKASKEYGVWLKDFEDQNWKVASLKYSINAIEIYNSEEFQEALKTWEKVKDSPLVKAMS